jgi:ankyrin repeat protein
MSNELQYYAASGNFERVKQLVEGGANIEETNHDGMTALSLAAWERDSNGYSDVVVYLVEHGADFEHADNMGMNALH